MKFENVVKWHQGLIHQMPEDEPLKCDCISLTDGEDCIEQMIFLAKVGNEFEVRVYKAHPKDTYVPNVLDFKVKRYEANDEFESFFFDRIFFARRFICNLKTLHPEYSQRPV